VRRWIGNQFCSLLWVVNTVRSAPSGDQCLTGGSGNLSDSPASPNNCSTKAINSCAVSGSRVLLAISASLRASSTAFAIFRPLTRQLAAYGFYGHAALMQIKVGFRVPALALTAWTLPRGILPPSNLELRPGEGRSCASENP
jgi:hypothetical protein